MIVQDFLTTDMYIPSEENANVELSDNVGDLLLTYSDGWPDAYWYGWLRWENAPDILKVSTVNCEGSDPFRKAVTASYGNPRNFNVGYIATGYSAYSQYWYGPLSQIQYYGENNGVYSDPINDLSPYLGSRFINKLDPRGVCPIHGGLGAPAENKINFFVSFTYRYNGSSTNYFLIAYIPFGDVADGINKFLKGEITRNLSISGTVYLYDNNNVAYYSFPGSAFDYVLDINSPDFGVKYPNVWTYNAEDSGSIIEVNVFMCGYNFPVGQDMLTEDNRYQNDTMRILPVISQNLNGVDYNSVGFTGYTNVAKFINNNISSIPADQGNTAIIDENIGMCYGGFNGTINTSANPYNYCPTFSESANFCVCPGYDNTTYIFRIMSPDEITHSQTLNMRYCTNDNYTELPSYGFGSGLFYPHISPENEYLCEWLTGEFDDIKDDLRPWQYGDISDNEYKPQDLPPYSPDDDKDKPTPIPTEDKFTGDATDNFFNRAFSIKGVQYYALTENLLSSFIQRLWSQPKSFYDAIQIAGRQTNSIFDYVESLRYYPINWNFSSANVEPIHFGTGAVLLESDGETAVQLSTADSQISSQLIGSFNLSDPKYHWRNNFLDYAPYTKISIYLPYVGTVELDSAAIASNEPISSATIDVLVCLDITTGCLTYYVMNNSNVILAQKTTKIAIDLPLSGNDSVQQSAAILRAQFNTTKQVLGSSLAPIASLAQGNPVGALQGAGNLYSSIGSAYLENSLAKKQVPVEIQSQGGVASNIFRVQIPYLTIHRQKYSNPNNYGHAIGFLAEETYVIKNISGFTTCRNPDLSGIGQATDKEKVKIKQILESGFYA